jgi:hypothetical protein
MIGLYFIGGKGLPSGYLTQPWKIPDKWKFIAGKFIYFYGPWIP